MTVGRDDVLHREALRLLGKLVDRKPGVDDNSLLGACAGEDVAVDLAIQTDIANPPLRHQISITSMQREALAVFWNALLLVCLYVPLVFSPLLLRTRASDRA